MDPGERIRAALAALSAAGEPLPEVPEPAPFGAREFGAAFTRAKQIPHLDELTGLAREMRPADVKLIRLEPVHPKFTGIEAPDARASTSLQETLLPCA